MLTHQEAFNRAVAGLASQGFERAHDGGRVPAEMKANLVEFAKDNNLELPAELA